MKNLALNAIERRTEVSWACGPRLEASRATLEQTPLGRSLTIDEVTYFRDVIRRITALLLLGPTLDANYTAAKANTYAWPRS